jgi:hypothetical protein
VRYSSKVDQLPIDYKDSKIIKEQNQEKSSSKIIQQIFGENDLKKF